MSASTISERARPVRWPRMRPRFIVEVDARPERVMDALRGGVERVGRAIEGRLSERHAVLMVPEAERQFWSTQLGLEVEDASGSGGRSGPSTRVLGVFSPHPDIWTAFVFAIGTLSAVAVFGAMYAVVQLTMGEVPTCLLASVIAVLAGGLVYTSTLVGQGLTADEMYRLRSFLDDCLDDARRHARRAPATARESAQL